MNNILIIGAGSIGALMGASLVKAGLKVTFAGKPGSEHTKRLKEKGLQLFYANRERLWISPLHPRVEFIDTATNSSKKFDIIIVAVKSNNLIKVVPYIKANSTPDTILIHAQNGIPYWWFNNDSYLSSLNQNLFNKLSSQRYLNTVDHQGILQHNLGDRTVVGCVVKAPCQRIEAGTIQVKKIPRIILGLTRNHNYNLKQQAQIKDLCDLFSKHGIDATYTNKIRTAVCNKLVINITTNVLSALTGRVIADLTANYYTNSLIKIIIAEVNQIFSCYGIKPEDLPTEEAIYAYIKAPGSQSHLPSLAQDFAQHKPGEISLITAPVEMAQIAHLRVPTLSILSELLQLCQTYSLRNHNGESHILTIDSASDNYRLTTNVCQSSIVDRWHISNLLAHLVQVNALTLNHQMLVSQPLS
jgi:2-dehydropantoate 2-reductase